MDQGQNNLNQNNFSNMQVPNYVQNNNNKTKQIIIISSIIVFVAVVVLVLIILLSKPDNNENKNSQQNQINNNKIENIVENENQTNENDAQNVIESEIQTNNSSDEIVKDNFENQENPSDEDTSSQTPNIEKRSLGQVSKFDNGISVKVTNNIEYLTGDSIYYNPIAVQIEIINESNKNFYQDNRMAYGIYMNFDENAVEIIAEDFEYTTFEIQPMYVLNNEVKTEKSYCMLRKRATFEFGDMDKYNRYFNINYFMLKPGEKTNAYLLCYFKQGLEDAKIKAIYLYNNSNHFMYIMD